MEIIQGHQVIFDSEKHQYFVDGKLVPSVSQICKMEYPDMYKGIDQSILFRAAVKGTNLHSQIEMYELYGKYNANNLEILNYIDIKRKLNIIRKMSEKIIIIKLNEQVICAGRFDLLADIEGNPTLIDFKRTTSIHYEYVKLQLNLYRLGLIQSYKESVENLMIIRLRYNQSEIINVAIDEEYTIMKLEKHKSIIQKRHQQF